MRNTINLNKKLISFSNINKKMLYINISLGIVFFLSQILVTAILGTKTQEIDLIRSKKEELRLQNEILVGEIDKAKSLNEANAIREQYGLQEKQVNFVNDTQVNDIALYGQNNI